MPDEQDRSSAQNLRQSQFVLLVVINSFVGGMVGLERAILPLIAESDFGIASKTAAIAFIATFGLTKAVMNLLAGRFSDRWGRRRMLILGWLFGIPVPILIMWAPVWLWILFANVLLGINQALTWSMTLVMKVDLAGQRQRGMAIGLNEFAGYSGLAIVALLSGFLASKYGLRPEPFYLGVVLSLAGLALSYVIKETKRGEKNEQDRRPFRGIFHEVSWRNPLLSTASIGGLVVNLKDGVLWGLMPLYLHSRGLGLEEIGTIVAVYPAMWGITQVYFGPLSDKVGRKKLIIVGFFLQGIGVVVLQTSKAYIGYLVGAVLIGIGTAMVYPTLLALVSDVASTEWRASALGIYRFWRDLGYACGALGAGVVADAYGLSSALGVTAGILFLVGFQVIFRIQESRSSNIL